ncbi:hypothetical protein RhiirA4_508657 [Rhizophagus irregularis]|uniref:Uncharacterized protein n=1 Tax=Rhizophagus irregularis TaxID=588596 RepID=A0A2I1HDK1_9GLOM|nr:hypothetical protein RhiirA4_508657 [Rhizophagus irregularis]
MNGSSSQSDSTPSNITSSPDNFNNSYKTSLHAKISSNCILLKLEEYGFITPDEKAKELIKELTEIKCLFALKLLFENSQNEFSPQILRNSLVALADPTPFDYYAEKSVARLELHLRTWVLVLEKICFTRMRLSKELRDRIYNSLPKFAEIHRKTTQIMQEGIENNFKPEFNQQKDDKSDEKIAKKRNYNIDFLLIHLRDTLHSLRDDETWFQEIIRRIKDLLKTALNITPGILSITGVNIPNDCSILSMLNQVRQSLSFKYPVASYYIDWRIMLIIQHNLLTWSECSEMIISKKFGELILMEYIWSFLEREWINNTNKSILDSQPKFDEVSNKVIKSLKNTGNILNDFTGNEPLALPYTLWFGLLDLAHNLIQKSTRKAIHGLCYYLAIESLNKAPSSFIQFKAIEILLHLHHIDNQMFSMIGNDFDNYMEVLNKNNLINSTEKFQKLLEFVNDKCLEDLKILNDDIGKEKKGKGKGKSPNQNSYTMKEQTSNSTILDTIANEMTCPISSEPVDQLCILKCQHPISLNNLKMLIQKKCPKCRKIIDDNDIRYLPQTSIYKNLYSKFSESGYILPSIKFENSDQDSDDSNNSEIDLILTKKKKFKNPLTKLNLNITLLSIVPIFTKKQHPIYQNIIKELNEKHYEKAETLCKKFLDFIPKSYSLRCILAFIYRCLNDYEQAHLYLEEAINLKPKKPIAYFICGEIFFWQNNYDEAINYLNKSSECKTKINNLYIVLGNSNFFKAEFYNYDEYYLSEALKNYETALKNDPNNYLCLKNCAYIYERIKDYQNALVFLDKLLSINENDSLILCYYGEILFKMGKYNNAISYFTKANIIDPENIHNLKKRTIVYFILQEYGKVLSDLDKVTQFNPSNISAYYLKCLIYYTRGDTNNATIAFNKITELILNSNYNTLEKTQLFYLECLLNKNNTTDLNTKVNQILNTEISNILLSIRCIIYIELGMYHEAELDLNTLYNSTDYYNFICLLKKYLNFWSYLVKDCYDRTDDLGITDNCSLYLYEKKKVYLVSNLIHYYNQFQESDPISLSGQVICSKNKGLNLTFPVLDSYGSSIIWKINVKKIISEDCFIRFTEKNYDYIGKNERILKYKDLLKLEGLGWIECRIPIKLNLWNSRLSIEIDSIDMKIDYIRFGSNKEEITYIPKMIYLLTGYHEYYPSTPEAFGDKYFSKKEMENLVELKDILNNF